MSSSYGQKGKGSPAKGGKKSVKILAVVGGEAQTSLPKGSSPKKAGSD